MKRTQHKGTEGSGAAVKVRPEDQKNRIEPIRYAKSYLFLIMFSTIDIILTYLIVIPNQIGLNGWEINPFADRVIQNHGFWGMIIYKFALTVFFIVLCEEVGRKRPTKGSRLAKLAVAIAAIPTVWSLVVIMFAS